MFYEVFMYFRIEDLGEGMWEYIYVSFYIEGMLGFYIVIFR